MHFARKLWIAGAIGALLIAIAVAVVCRRPAEAEWTVMVYLAADNGLEAAADADFRRLASIGSTNRMNLVVQFDRKDGDGGNSLDSTKWSETLRFRVTKRMVATRGNAYETLPEQNMADGATLAAFIRDTQRRFPAKHYALVMWGHGYGPRLFNQFTAASLKTEGECASLPSYVTGVSYKSGTPDHSAENDVLYNSELVTAVQQILPRPLDLLVLDECVMGMVEVLYAARSIADIVVASEELVPETGLPYEMWLGALKRAPWMSPRAAANVVVKTYQFTYRHCATYTLSAFATVRADEVERAISLLATELIRDFRGQFDAVYKARLACKPYGEAFCTASGTSMCIHHIDLQRFCEQLVKATQSTKVRDLAGEVIEQLRIARVANGPSPESVRLLGSNGLAIYFPPDGNSYCNDQYNQCGYEQDNDIYPLEFVKQSSWDEFLHQYFAAVTTITQPAHPDRPVPVDRESCRSISNCAAPSP